MTLDNLEVLQGQILSEFRAISGGNNGYTNEDTVDTPATEL